MHWCSLFDLLNLMLLGSLMPFVMALWMELGFDCCWVSLWYVLPCSSLTEGHSAHHVLYAVVQVLPEKNHKAQGINPHLQKYLPPKIPLCTANEPVLIRV